MLASLTSTCQTPRRNAEETSGEKPVVNDVPYKHSCITMNAQTHRWEGSDWSIEVKVGPVQDDLGGGGEVQILELKLDAPYNRFDGNIKADDVDDLRVYAQLVAAVTRPGAASDLFEGRGLNFGTDALPGATHQEISLEMLVRILADDDFTSAVNPSIWTVPELVKKSAEHLYRIGLLKRSSADRYEWTAKAVKRYFKRPSPAKKKRKS